MLDLGLYVLYALLGIAIATAIIFPIINAIKDPGALLKIGIGIGIFVVLFGISYALSDSNVSLKTAAAGIDASSSRLIGAGLIMFYIVLAGSILALIYSEISKAFK
ncbi:MAG: hypothetical protein OEV74_12235 [Cyclobacteriaceae bacterium]|jgi:hypothetical protein|nr:hypothetical protein [Cyclobacteriaceae bacterium]MDH4297046.1 hypothetical protein [Cyclobacteriaceae bacterium]MDH5248688.1 hypothetical protein [Cyclobacteriaceae bacterium]